MPTPTVLLIGSDPSLVMLIQGVVDSIRNLRLNVRAGLGDVAGLRREGVAVVVVHLSENGDAGSVGRLLQAIASSRRPLATVVISDAQEADHARTMLREGAADCLTRPLDHNRLAYLLHVLTVRARYPATAAKLALAEVASVGEQAPFLYCRSVGIGRIMDQVRRVAPQLTTVLLGGETGTGKTHLARLIHELSPRRVQPFLVVNCGALSTTLIESEMFGHVRGAFTGADYQRLGKFAEAGRGTLLLDEIDLLPLALQAKLLRVIEERLFEPVGGNRSQSMEARLIVASNRQLDQEVEAGRFRADLYYRLNVVGFYLPPLRERRELIPALAGKFLREFAARDGRPVHGIAPRALQALQGYDWPGNIREVRNLIERAVALCPGREIDVEDLPAAVQRNGPEAVTTRPPEPTAASAPADRGTLAQTKEEAEAQRILQALRKNQNNRRQAAAELGISRMTLYKKLRRYGLMSARCSAADRNGDGLSTKGDA
jgi:DNA-binding NtrC family response regulator